MVIPELVENRIEAYQESRSVRARRRLGTGTQGTVLLFDDPSQSTPIAVKFHERKVAYDREVGVYLRLQDLEVDSVLGHRVPILVGYDDELLAIEMTTVSPPFVLDFGGAYLDRAPDYTPEIWRDWREMKSDAFEDKWPIVEEILGEFESFGVYIADVNTSNIRFN